MAPHIIGNLSKWLEADPSAHSRRGMTLMEILVATGILAMGMMGICALLPLGIRNTATSVDRTIGASVAKTAITSLQHETVDLGFGTAATVLDCLDKLDGTPGNIAKAILYYKNDGNTIDRGSAFVIPGFLSNASQFGTSDVVILKEWDEANTKWVETEYYWAATFIPLGTDTINESTVYVCQVAIWRKYELLIDGVEAGGPDLHFSAKSKNVDVIGPPATFWDKIRVGDYVRGEKQMLWYKVAALDEAGDTLVLAAPFPFNFGMTQTADVASRFKLIALYNTVIYP